LTRGAARSAIAGAVIEYAGTDDQGALDIEADDVSVTDTVIRDAKGIGVRVGDEAEIAGVTFERAGAIAASLPAASVGALGACAFGDGYVQIRGGTVERDATWRHPGTYFVVDETVRVDGKNARATVTIEADRRHPGEAGAVHGQGGG
jgi:hypothetical protein